MNKNQKQFMMSLIELCNKHKVCIRVNGFLEFLENMPETDETTAEFRVTDVHFAGFDIQEIKRNKHSGFKFKKGYELEGFGVVGNKAEVKEY